MEKGNKLQKISLLAQETVGIIHSFLSKEECKELIQQATASGFRSSPPSGGGHGRTGKRKIFVNDFG
jgi:hypothetical protein